MGKQNTIICALLTVLAGCSSNSPKEEDALLAGTGIRQAVDDRLFVGMGNPGFLAMPGDKEKLSALIQAGFISVVPVPDGAPWWRLQVQHANGPQSDYLPFSLGARTIIGKHDQKSWSEGSVSYFAETVDYTLTLNPELKTSSTTLGPFSIRLVLVNQPAVGSWQIDSQSDLSSLQRDKAALESALEVGGSAALDAAISVASKQASDMLGQQIQRAAGLEAIDGQGIVRKPGARLAFYIPDNELSNGTTFGMAKSTCNNVKAGGLNWHLATATESPAVLSLNRGNLIIDSPTSSIWKGRLAGVSVLIVDSFGFIGRQQVESNLPGSEPISTRWKYTIAISPDGSAKWNSEAPSNYGLALDQVPVAWNNNAGQTGRKPLCAANSSGTVPVAKATSAAQTSAGSAASGTNMKVATVSTKASGSSSVSGGKCEHLVNPGEYAIIARRKSVKPQAYDVAVSADNRIMWMASAIDMNTLQQYLKLATSVTPKPYFVLFVNKSSSASVAERVRSAIVASGAC
ncbi:hypothetical protein GCM10009087_52510 [Sphingomonas oligophenolica]|uniref:Uncharacterized protein n=1 Tax=Sphingomonas oligophenolica TaxID=301154 RepID=A0ABU9Y702_9SPHN